MGRSSAAGRLIDVVERKRRRILDRMLRFSSAVLDLQPVALNVTAGTFLDRLLDSLAEGHPNRLVAWIG